MKTINARGSQGSQLNITGPKNVVQGEGSKELADKTDEANGGRGYRFVHIGCFRRVWEMLTLAADLLKVIFFV